MQIRYLRRHGKQDKVGFHTRNGNNNKRMLKIRKRHSGLLFRLLPLIYKHK